jgi:hypothetical protein
MNPFIVLHPPPRLQAINDQLPGAIHVSSYFAFPIQGSAAWTVKEAFGAASHRAYACCVGKYAIPTPLASLAPDPRFVKGSQEGRIEGRNNGQLIVDGCHGLNTGPACQRQHDIRIQRNIETSPDQIRFALSLNGFHTEFRLPTTEVSSAAEFPG